MYENVIKIHVVLGEKITNLESMRMNIRKFGSMYDSEKLPSYPTPNLTFCPKREVSVNVRLGEGQVAISQKHTLIDKA